MHILNQPGQRRPYTHALRHWKLSRKKLDAEVDAAFCGIRQYLGRYGIRSASDRNRFRRTLRQSIDLRTLVNQITALKSKG